LVQAFVAAHLIHFTTVAVLLASFDRGHVLHHPARAALAVLFGLSLAVLAGLTAVPRASRSYTALHAVTLYALFFPFFLAFASNRVKPLRLYALVLLCALILRQIPRFATRRASPALP
jgi:hypothetical protein